MNSAPVTVAVPGSGERLIQEIVRKLGARNRVQAAVRATKERWV